MNDVRLKMSPPWVTYINKLQALFDGDPLIAFNIDATKPSVVLATSNGDKATALRKLLPTEVQFGNITLHVGVDGPESNRAFLSNKELFESLRLVRTPHLLIALRPLRKVISLWISLMQYLRIVLFSSSMII